jgi:hypothetical protein
MTEPAKVPPVSLTYLRISCAPMPSTQSSACRICWMRLLAWFAAANLSGPSSRMPLWPKTP